MDLHFTKSLKSDIPEFRNPLASAGLVMANPSSKVYKSIIASYFSINISIGAFEPIFD